jgi:hypothetical protein
MITPLPLMMWIVFGLFMVILFFVDGRLALDGCVGKRKPAQHDEQ